MTSNRVIEDQYPLMLVHGLALASEVLKLTHEAGCASVNEFLPKYWGTSVAMNNDDPTVTPTEAKRRQRVLKVQALALEGLLTCRVSSDQSLLENGPFGVR